MKIDTSDWQEMSFLKLESKYSLSRQEIYDLAVSQKLYLIPSIVERCKFTEIEKEFIDKNQNLTISQIATILHKSYNATLMNVKLLGYYHMIGRK